MMDGASSSAASASHLWPLGLEFGDALTASSSNDLLDEQVDIARRSLSIRVRFASSFATRGCRTRATLSLPIAIASVASITAGPSILRACRSNTALRRRQTDLWRLILRVLAVHKFVTKLVAARAPPFCVRGYG